MSLVALVVAVALLLPAFWFARKATLRRLAIRNVTSRPAEAVLVTVGTMLGTAIIVASFVVGDTISRGASAVVDNSLGPIDETVVIDDPFRLGELEAAIIDADLADVDGVVSVLSLPTAVTTTASDAVGEPSVWIAEIDFNDARAFGGGEPTGFEEAGSTPSVGTTVLTSRIATDLSVEAGDTIEVHVFGTTEQLTVSRVIDHQSSAGWNSVYVAPGTIAAMFENAELIDREPRAEVLVSNVGDIYGGVELTEQVTSDLERVTAGMEGVDVEDVKRGALESAAADGASFTSLFNGIGSFAVIAGILLIVNLFVMLAEERKVSLGIMRSVGFTRTAVKRAFVIEGAVYSAAAAFAGVGVGLGVGWVLVQALRGIFAAEINQFSFTFTFEPESLMLAAAIGLGITMITIWITAARLSRFNVIAAIRDLPAPATKRGRIKTILAAFAGLAIGAMVAFWGISEEIPSAAVAGVPIIAFSTVPLLRPILGERISGVLAGAAAIAWGVAVFTLLPGVMEGSDIDSFVVQGVVMVAGAVAISASASGVWRWMVNLTSRAGAGLSSRLGLVYPLARRGRTGLLLGMFSLVIFTITFLAVFSGILADQTRGLADDSSAGYDIMASSASFNPASADDVAAVDGVASVATLDRAWVEFLADDLAEPVSWAVTGFDESLLEYWAPTLGDRLDIYASDRAAFEAVLADPGLIIIDDFFLDTDSGPGSEPRAPGDQVQVVNADDSLTTLTVAGVLASDWVFAGSYMSADYVAENHESASSRMYIAADEGSDPATVAGRLNAQLIANGLEAQTFAEGVEAEVAETVGLMRLFQGFLSLGLVIGIAGLSVVLVRAVRERRRAIGVLRALGAQADVVKRAFLVESAFVAVQGVLIGVVLGLVSSYQVIVNSATFGEANLSFVWPWGGLAVAIVIPTVAALLAAVVPARRASGIRPAVALRTE